MIRRQRNKVVFFLILHPVCSFSSQSLPTPFCSQPNSLLLPFLFPKWQVSHEAYQAAVRLSASPCFKAGQDNPVWGAGSQKSVKESEKGSVSTVWSGILFKRYSGWERLVPWGVATGDPRPQWVPSTGGRQQWIRDRSAKQRGRWGILFPG